MNITSGPITHTVRASVLEYEAVWRLGADGLELTGGPTASADTAMSFPYAAVSELRLRFDPTRVDSARHRCELRIKSGGTIAIPSTHYVSLGEFEDRSATYVPLVRGLIARVAAANPGCRFRSGKRPFVFWLEHAFLLAMLLLLALVLGLVGGVGLTQLALFKLAIVATYIPLAIRYARKNRPRAFDPAAIPAQALPGG